MPIQTSNPNNLSKTNSEKHTPLRTALSVGGSVVALAGIGWVGEHVRDNANPKIIKNTHIEQAPDYAHGPGAFGDVVVTTQTPEYNK